MTKNIPVSVDGDKMSMSSWFAGKSGAIAASAVTSPISYASIEDAQESVNKLIGVGTLTLSLKSF